jgi:hypothetical protein
VHFVAFICGRKRVPGIAAAMVAMFCRAMAPSITSAGVCISDMRTG